MRTAILCVIALVLALSIASLGQKGPAARKSSDGVDYPVAAQSLWQASLPMIGQRLGDAPDGTADKMFNSSASKPLLQKHLNPSLFDFDWFVVGLAGADVGGIDITDGRITRIALLYKKLSKVRAEDTAKKIAAIGHTTASEHMRISVKGKTGSTMIVMAAIDEGKIEFSVDQVEWSILYHPTKDEIAKAMRSKLPVNGMNIDQAKAAFGKPLSSGSARGGATELVWEQREPITPTPASPKWSTDARQSYFDFQAAVLAAPKPVRMRTMRRVAMVFDKGIAIDCSDDYYEK